MAADLIALIPFIFLGALLYSSVGHGGATIYLAILTLAGYAAHDITTTVLVLNILAAAIGFVMFGLAGHLRWRLLWPFLLASVPFAYLGGRTPLSNATTSLLLGLVLLAAALRFLMISRPPGFQLRLEGWRFFAVALPLGAVLGFLAGATGIGGGIFLSPILFAIGWASLKEAGAVASAFIVLNSLAGLAAKLPRSPLDTHLLLPLTAVVAMGALVGSFAGARRLPPRALQAMLGAVLLAASAKSLLGAF